MNLYLSILAIITALCAVVGLLLLADDYHRRNPGPARKHRAGQIDRAPRDFSPLNEAVRRHLAPTFHDDDAATFVPADRLEETRALLAPSRPEVSDDAR